MPDGPQLTDLRRQVLELVSAAERPIKAYELLAALSEVRGPTAPPTVYRVLNYLTKWGLIHRIESLNAYASCTHAAAGRAHAFLVCSACNAVTEVDSADARRLVERVSSHRDFRLRTVAVEVNGACRKCSDAGGTA